MEVGEPMNRFKRLSSSAGVAVGTLTGFFAPQYLHEFFLWTLRMNMILTGFYLLVLLIGGIWVAKKYISKDRDANEISILRISIYGFLTGVGFGLMGLSIQGLVFSML